MKKKHSILNSILILVFLVMSINVSVFADTTVKVESINLNKTTATLTVGATDNLTVTINPSNATDQSLRWSSSNTNVATVFNGVVMAIAPGNAVITATSEDGFKSASCMVTVTNPIITISLNKTTETLTQGETDTLIATVTKTNMNQNTVLNQMVTFKSSNNNVVQVGGNGFIYAAGPGTATITASTEGGSNVAACFVNVNAKNNLSSIALDKKADFIVVGGTDKLTASIVSTGTTNPVVNWTTSDPNIVKVVEGVLIGMNPGTAVITAASGDGTSTATCNVTVYSAGTVPASIQSIVLNKLNTNLTVGASETLVFTVNPPNATNYSLQWKSSNPNVATVNGNGMVSAVSPGSSLITVSALNGTISSSCTVTVTAITPPVNTLSTTRLGGSNRYETSVVISKANWKDTSTYAILASGNDFPDGLSAAALAKKYSAPVLLTDKNSIPESVLSELSRLHVTKVIITGGVGVISQSVEKKLNTLGITTERIGGKDRYETSIKVAEKVGNSTGAAIVVNGYQWTDALSVSSIAAKKNIPIILTDKNTLPDSVKTYITNNKVSKVYVLGDTDMISDKVVSKLPNVSRITGSNEYERNINIIKNFENDIDFSKICVASGRDFPDSLSGSALAAMNASAIVLVDDKNVKDITTQYIKSKSSKINNVFIFGLQGAVSDSIIQSLFNK